jgi:Na+-transporting methylmalonyl-CoA/oxaloacetate decarboxylase gamma subunit
MLAGGLQPKRLQRLLFEAGLREGWQAGIVDRNAILLARDRLPEMYVGVVAQQPMVAAVSGGKPSGLFDVVDRTGISVKNSFERSASTGWVVGVAVPTAVVNEPLWRTALIMTGLGIVMTLLSLLLAVLVASHLSRSIRRLGIAAVAIASGDVVRMPASNIAELQDVSRSIEVTGAVARRNRRANVTTANQP